MGGECREENDEVDTASSVVDDFVTACPEEVLPRSVGITGSLTTKQGLCGKESGDKVLGLAVRPLKVVEFTTVTRKRSHKLGINSTPPLCARIVSVFAKTPVPTIRFTMSGWPHALGSCLMRTLCLGNAGWLNVVNCSLLSARKSWYRAGKLSRFRKNRTCDAQAAEASRFRMAVWLGQRSRRKSHAFDCPCSTGARRFGEEPTCTGAYTKTL